MLPYVPPLQIDMAPYDIAKIEYSANKADIYDIYRVLLIGRRPFFKCAYSKTNTHI